MCAQNYHGSKRGRYDNMIHLPHPKAFKPMSAVNRAAQFSPFAALTGYDERVTETSRLTDDEIYLTDNAMAVLDYKLQFLSDHINESPNVTITYFIPDVETHSGSKKAGGEYLTHSGIIKKIDTYHRTIIFNDMTEILIERITDIDSSVFGIY